MPDAEHADDGAPGFLAWDHNTYYQPRLLRALPRPCARVLDVGCGAGAFAARLAKHAERVDALDLSPEMISAARRSAPPNVTCILGDVREIPLQTAAYDAITSISALHHMPLPVVLPRLASALRPGGVLVAVAHHRAQYPGDLIAQGVSVLAVYGRRMMLLLIPRARKYRHALDQTGMPMKEPELTVRQVRQQAADLLPGVKVRRLMLRRYQLEWCKPTAAAFEPSADETR